MALTAVGGVLLLVNPELPVSNLGELVALVKAVPNRYSYASWGIGSNGHLTMEWLKTKTGMQISHIPYNNQTLADVITGRVALASTAWATALGHIQGKTLRAVGVTSEARLKAAPDLPTFREQGYDVAAATWAALSGPAGLPPDIVSRLNGLVAKFLQNPELLKPLDQDILEVRIMTPEQITTHFKNEITVWTPVVANFLAKRK